MIPKITGIEAFKGVFKLQKNPLKYFMEVYDKFGDSILMKLLGQEFLLIRDPAHVKYVLQENSSNYTKSIMYNELQKLVGKGLLTSEGAEWKKNRRIAQASFKKSSVEGFSKIFYEETKSVIDEWKNKTELDLSKEFMRITFRIVGKALFSTSVDEDSQKIDDALSIAQVRILDRAQGLFKMPYSLPTPKNLKLKKAINDINEVVDNIIRTRIESKERKQDLLDALIYTEDEETKERLSPKQIRDEAITFLLAGHETTSNAMTWFFYLMTENKGHYKRLENEIRTSVPKLGEIGTKDLLELKLADIFLKESMRIYPPAWMIERASIKKDKIGEIDIEAKTMVSICVYAIHRNPKYWTEVEKFIPERFLPENEKNRPHYAYIPFGGGPRICIGQNFAFTESLMILATIIREYTFELTPNQIIEKESLLTLRPKYGMRMKLIKNEN